MHEKIGNSYILKDWTENYPHLFQLHVIKSIPCFFLNFDNIVKYIINIIFNFTHCHYSDELCKRNHDENVRYKHTLPYIWFQNDKKFEVEVDWSW